VGGRRLSVLTSLGRLIPFKSRMHAQRDQNGTGRQGEIRMMVLRFCLLVAAIHGHAHDDSHDDSQGLVDPWWDAVCL
jgi:hypothetical protein